MADIPIENYFISIKTFNKKHHSKMYTVSLRSIIAILLIFQIREIYCAGKIYTTENNKNYYIENENAVSSHFGIP